MRWKRKKENSESEGDWELPPRPTHKQSIKTAANR